MSAAKLKIKDPDGEAWHAEASRRWQAAEQENPEQPIDAYDPVPLPDFAAGRSAAVTREVYGRFVLDRDTGIVHDCYAAAPACEVDGIRNGTFFHFASELDPAALPCEGCLGG